MPRKDKDQNIILEEIKRHNKVLLEHMEGQVKAVAEQYTSIRQDINEIKSELDTVKTAVMENNHGLKRIEQKLDASIANHEQRIKKIEEKAVA